MPWWTGLPSLGEIALGPELGWEGAVALQLAVLSLLAPLCWLIEDWAPRRATRRAARRRDWGTVVSGPWPLVGGIASTSVHGWLWAGAALIGTPVGLRLRRSFGLE